MFIEIEEKEWVKYYMISYNLIIKTNFISFELYILQRLLLLCVNFRLSIFK